MHCGEVGLRWDWKMICRRREDMNASNSPWTPELQATVRQLFAKHKTATEIGHQVGMSKNQIIGWLDRQGLKRRELNPYRLSRREQARERERTARCDYDGPTTLDRLRGYQDKMNAARWWPEFVNMVNGTIVLRYLAPLPSANLSRGIRAPGHP
jgi:hypothetical protein